MENTLPQQFIERLKEIIPHELQASVERGFTRARPLTVRINTLKTERENVHATLRTRACAYRTVPWCPDALILDGMSPEECRTFDLVEKGVLYRQSLASMIPSLVLNPHYADTILDLCAAPGSKTSHMAALMNNRGWIVAVDAVRGRYYKLQSVLALLSVTNATCRCKDGRRYYEHGTPFDKILIDAPCSSEGRFNVHEAKTYAYWSTRKIREMAHKQRGLIFAASRLLKEGGVMVYSTCTFAPEENEGVINWFLKKTEGRFAVQPITFTGVATYPALMSWQGKRFARSVKHCMRIQPTELMEGFFLAKLVRKK